MRIQALFKFQQLFIAKARFRVPSIRRTSILAFCLTSLFSTTLSFAHNLKTVESGDLLAVRKVKSAYLYNFLKYIEFKNRTEKQNDTSFLVCVLGVSPFGATLEMMNGKKARNKTVQVKQMFDLANTKECDIIYVSRSKRLELTPVLSALSKRPILTVSDIESFTQKGGIVRFVTKNEKIGIEINLTAAKRSGIKISALLLEIAEVIE